MLVVMCGCSADDVEVLFDDGVRYVASKANVRRRVSQQTQHVLPQYQKYYMTGWVWSIPTSKDFMPA